VSAPATEVEKRLERAEYLLRRVLEAPIGKPLHSDLCYQVGIFLGKYKAPDSAVKYGKGHGD